MRRLMALAVIAAWPARGELRVVSSIPVLGSLAKEVGGDRIRVDELARPTQDPHYVDARPNLMVTLNRADLLLQVGLELEIGWLPPLVLGSRNPRIQPGAPGNLDCSQFIPPLDVPTARIDRSMGDIHPLGNPHYWLPPDNAKHLARGIARRLAQLDPEGTATYEQRLQRFEARVAEKEAAWAPLVDKLRGTKVVTFHRSWTHVSRWLGLVEVGYLEPKPGIPPDPAHLARLIALMREKNVPLLIMEIFYTRQTAALVAEKAGARLLTLPTDVGAARGAEDWFGLVEALLKAMAEPFRR